MVVSLATPVTSVSCLTTVLSSRQCVTTRRGYQHQLCDAQVVTAQTASITINYSDNLYWSKVCQLNFSKSLIDFNLQFEWQTFWKKLLKCVLSLEWCLVKYFGPLVHSIFFCLLENWDGTENNFCVFLFSGSMNCHVRLPFKSRVDSIRDGTLGCCLRNFSFLFW